MRPRPATRVGPSDSSARSAGTGGCAGTAAKESSSSRRALALDCDEAGLSEPELEEQAIAYTIGALLTVDGTKEMSLALEWFDAGAAIVERIGWPSMPLLRLVVPLRRGVFETYRSGVPPVG